MTPRRWGLLIVLFAATAGVVAFRLQFNPCLVSGLIVLVGLMVVCLLVSIDARRKLAASRTTLMRAAQMCPACGYTIRAATDRCPECGTPVEPPD